jgi:hypothetical protein
MLKVIISISLFLITPNTWGIEVEVEDNYLQSIMIVGNQKIAYFAINGETISAREGDKFIVATKEVINVWRVISIQANSVKLKAASGIITELRLDHELPNNEVLEEETENYQSLPPPPPSLPKVQPGYRLIDTPFGQFTVKEEPKPPENKNFLIDEEEKVPDGYHLVKTPFGSFLMKN